MLNIKDCMWDKKYCTTTSGSQITINQKLDIYDKKIYNQISDYFSMINNYSSDYINSSNDELKRDAQFLKKKYKNYIDNEDQYKKIFIDTFNKIYNTDSWSIYSLNQKMYDTQMDFLSSFPEYYLMVKQTEKYTCLYYYAYKKLIFFFKNFGVGGSVLCPLDQTVDEFINNMKYLENYINTNEINKDMTYDEINEQRLKNSYNSYSQYDNYLEKLKNNISKKGQEILILYNEIGSWTVELQMALKVISLGNIIMTSNNNDAKDFEDLSKVMLTYQSELNEKYEKTNKYYYLKIKGQIVTQQGIPIFIQFKKFVKPDYSNFQELLTASVRVVLNTCGLTTKSIQIIDNLPGGEGNTDE